MVTQNHQLTHITAAFRSCIRKLYHFGFNLEDPIDVWYVYLDLLISKL